MSFKKKTLTTILALSTTYLMAQSPLELARQQRLQQQQQTTQESTTPQNIQSQTPTLNIQTTPQASRYRAQNLEQTINLGTISVGDTITNFTVRLDETEFNLKRDKPVEVKYEGVIYGLLNPQQDGSWKYEGTIHSLKVGENILNAEFKNEINLKTTANFVINTTNKAPELGDLEYVFKNNRTGDEIRGTTKAQMVGGKYVFNLGDVPANYVLQTLKIIAQDEDGNLKTENNLLYDPAGKIIGTFKEVEPNIFKYESLNRELQQTLGVRRKTGRFEDRAGLSAEYEIMYGVTGNTSKVESITITTTKQGTIEQKLYETEQPTGRGNRRRWKRIKFF